MSYSCSFILTLDIDLLLFSDSADSDVGAGVVDRDYRGELGVVLFKFDDTDFQINMGDKVAQLIFEKIKTPEIREVNSFPLPQSTTGFTS